MKLTVCEKLFAARFIAGAHFSFVQTVTAWCAVLFDIYS